MSTHYTKSNIPMICDYCGRGFSCKAFLIKHILVHTAQKDMPRTDGLTCVKCNMIFRNKGLLMCHNAKIHKPISTPQSPIPDTKKSKYKCQVCQTNFLYLKHLKHHIRETHFNLLSHIPYCHFKKVNQVWFEKVLNSKNIVEIKKVAHNILLLRKLDDNTQMKVSEQSTEVIDLRNLYPTNTLMTCVECTYCFKTYDKAYINKHVKDIHMRYKDEPLEISQPQSLAAIEQDIPKPPSL